MIVGIILAAGEGHRIGQPKAWLPTNREGECFLERACAVLDNAGVDRVIAIVPSESEARAHRAFPGAVLVPNPWPEEGQMSSLQLGLRATAALGFDADAVVVLPVDVPLVSVATVQSLMDRWRDSRVPVVRPVSADGRHGHPVIFGRALFEVLLAADRTAGAKPIVRAHAGGDGDVPVNDEGAFLDVDTAEDYARAFGREL